MRKPRKLRAALMGGWAYSIPAPLFAAADSGGSGAALDYAVSGLAFISGALLVWIYFKAFRHHEEAVRPDEANFRNDLIFSAPNSAFYYKNLKTQKEWFSESLQKLLELNAKKLAFHHIVETLQEESREQLNQGIIDLQAGQSEITLELCTKAGMPVKCIGTVLERGGERHLVLWWRDITVHRRQMDALTGENDRIKRELQGVNNLLNALPLPVWMRDKELAIRYCNLAYMEACEEKGDHSQAEALELYLQGRSLAEKAKQASQQMKDRRFLVMHGDRKLYDIIETPWQNNDGHLSGIAIDLSEMDALQQELERTKSAQSDLLEGSASAMAIYGPDMRLKFFNNAFVTLWKLEEEWLRSQPGYGDILEKLRENRSLPEQANFPAFKQHLLKMFSELIGTNEEFLYLPDGRTIRMLAIPHTFGGILFAYEDVTDRLALERSYNTLIAVQKETLDNLHEGVAVFGEDGRLKLSNPVYNQMWNLTPELSTAQLHINDLLNRNKGLFYFSDWEASKSEFIAMMHRREVITQHIERKDGKVYNLTKVPLPDGQTLLSYVDITDSTLVERSLREKNDALEEADRVKSEFLANISYELRSPLTSISGFAEMLRLNYFGELTEVQREYIGNIEEASQHLMSLINDILDIASIEAGYMQLNIRRFDIHALLQSMQSIVAERVADAKIRFALQCEASVGFLEGDEERIRQVLLNLLINAIRYTDGGGEVVLGAMPDAAAPDSSVVFWVQDDGIGIPEEEQEVVFTKFYRSVGAKKRQSSGTGLGLSMVKSFIELHGGHVQLTSSPGQGTRVECHVPRHHVSVAAPVAAETVH